MQIRQITESAGVTMNIGQFSSIRYEHTATADLDPGEHEPTARLDLYRKVERRVSEVARFIAQHKRLPLETELGTEPEPQADEDP